MRTLGGKVTRPYFIRAADLLERYRSRLEDLSEVDYEGVGSTRCGCSIGKGR